MSPPITSAPALEEVAESPEKKQKIEEDTKVTKDAEMQEVKEVKEAEKEAQELEVDAKKDTGARITDVAAFLPEDTTLNVLQASVGNMLMALTDGTGMQYLCAGARGNVGVKSGRYMFEAKIVEQTSPWDENGKKSMTLGKHAVRLGFAAAGSSLFLGDGEDSICFDNDGLLVSNNRKAPLDKSKTSFGREDMLSVVLNIEKGHANCNTVSLFKNGQRVCQPQALPEAMKGKTLFPCISFKNSTVHFNFGQPCVPLPFKCKVLKEAIAKEVTVAKYDVPEDGKYKVLFPVSLPDEGTFNWLDSFLEKNPGYTEISDRAIISWAEKSGMAKVRAKLSSNDKPEVSFGAPSLDDIASIKRVLYQAASVQPRNVVIMEVQNNLLKEQRITNLAKFKTPIFKTVAEIMVGEPPADLVKLAQKMRLGLKQEASDRAFKATKLEEKRQWSLRKQKREADKARKKAEKARVKVLEEAKKQQQKAVKRKAKEAEKAKKTAVEEAEKAKKLAVEEAEKAEEEKKPEEAKDESMEGAEKKEEPEAKVEEEVKAEEKKKEEEEDAESEQDEEEKKEDPESEGEETEAEPAEEDPPKVVLSDEEKALKFFPAAVPDLTQYALSTTFAKFSLPDATEGFDEVKTSWGKPAQAATVMKDWILQRKVTSRVEDIRPSEWFNQKWRNWQTVLPSWTSQQSEYKTKQQKKITEKAQKIARKAQAERNAKVAAERKAQEAAEAEEKKAQEAAKAEEKKAQEAAEGGEKKEDEEMKPDPEKEAKPEEKQEEKPEEKQEEASPMEVEEEEPEEPEINFDGVDIFGVQDIGNVGSGTPLFRDFQFEDFSLLGLRFEMHLLVHAFRKDVNDPEREGIHMDHLGFYYQRYYKKTLNFKQFGVNTSKELVDLVHDTIYAQKNGVLMSWLPEELETAAVFVKLTEEARRHRIIRIDMGEESAKLKIERFPGGDKGKGEKRGWTGEQQQQQQAWGKGDMGKMGKMDMGKMGKMDMGKMGKMDMGKMGKMDMGMGKMDMGKGKMDMGKMGMPQMPMPWGMPQDDGWGACKGFGKDGGKAMDKGWGPDKGAGKSGKDAGKGWKW